MIRQVIAASQLPVTGDTGGGFGGARPVTRTVRGYEELGVSTTFIEDQDSPVGRGQAD